MTTPRVLILPGWLDSGPAHWQTRWQALHGCERVQQADWTWPRRGDWMSQLDNAVRDSERPTVLAAHSLGCHLVAAWAAHSSLVSRIQGALLVAPPDLLRDDMPPNIFSWRPVVRERLPFPSIAVLSSDDPYGALSPLTALCEGWGAEVIDIGPRGHLNGDSGLGDWPDGWALVRRLS